MPTKEEIQPYIDGKPGAHKEMLFDRQGSQGHYNDKEKWSAPKEYWYPHITVNGKEIGVRGPDAEGINYADHYSKKEAVDAAKRFQQQCINWMETGSSEL